MPIALARVDNRLVHGQILSAWVPALDVDAILVADDEALANPLVRSAMSIAIPPDVTFEVSSVAAAGEAALRLARERTLLVLLRDVSDATRAIRSGLGIERLNIGNVHFSQGRRPVTHAVYLAPEEIDALAAIEAQGVAVELRTLPKDSPLDLAELRRRVAGP